MAIDISTPDRYSYFEESNKCDRTDDVQCPGLEVIELDLQDQRCH
jgi:hypothetical protein